ncbi:CaiB/BaiF CoA transferase family protein [Paraburkholderia ferrariae]|uniref:CaiB/BaiF CoA transferase family protein n=1 Tax=Paraburkholderia ferrariae TaxID=386056 RepID=UPI000483E7A2|nr:CaiB/BaiF CoA-transferase family protein [Paraburkholderia ferrariae]
MKSTEQHPARSSGPLSGIKVVEFAGLGPAPFCAMVLADLGAHVLRIDRLGPPSAGAAMFDPAKEILQRGRQVVALDLKRLEAREAALRLIGEADVLIEGFRPGVMERLSLGPERCLTANPRLIFGRITGWGQEGPLAHTAGHDINYLALSGVLNAIGRRDSGPVPPLNLVADFGGGAMLLTVGVLAALLRARIDGKGQVVDAAMIDGCALLEAMTLTLFAMGAWRDERQANLLDGGTPRYDTYACADGKHVAVGALEPQFYHLLLEGLCLADDPAMQQPDDRTRWPTQRERIAAAFMRHPRDEWVRRFEGSDACVSPVLSLSEAPHHPHNRARGTFVTVNGLLQPAVAPRFSATPTDAPPPLPGPDAYGASALRSWGWPEADVQALVDQGVLCHGADSGD